MSGAVPLNDAQTHKAALREQARKSRVAQKNKDEISLQIVQAFMALPQYVAAKTVMFYVDAGSEVRTRHTLPRSPKGGETHRGSVLHCRDE